MIGFDSGVDSDIPVTTAATDNVAAAALAADKLAEAIGGSGKIGVIVHDQTSRTGIDRRDGFINEMKSKYPNITIVGPQYGAGDQLKSADLAKAMIQATPDIKGFFGANEGSAIGVINAVNELKMEGKIQVVGYDSGKSQIDAINSGLMPGAITQNPIGIGDQCVEAAVKAIKGESSRRRSIPGSPGTTSRTSTTRRSRPSSTSSPPSSPGAARPRGRAPPRPFKRATCEVGDAADEHDQRRRTACRRLDHDGLPGHQQLRVHVSAPTRVSVERAIAELGYVPNALARQLPLEADQDARPRRVRHLEPVLHHHRARRRGRRRGARVRRHVLQHR